MQTGHFSTFFYLLNGHQKLLNFVHLLIRANFVEIHPVLNEIEYRQGILNVIEL